MLLWFLVQCGHTVIGLESSSSSSFLKFSKNRSNSSSVIILFPFQNILQAVSAALYYLGRISWGVTKCRSLEASLGQQSRQEPTIGHKTDYTGYVTVYGNKTIRDSWLYPRSLRSLGCSLRSLPWDWMKIITLRTDHGTADQFCTETVTFLLNSREESSKRCRIINSSKASNLNTCFLTLRINNQSHYLEHHRHILLFVWWDNLSFVS